MVEANNIVLEHLRGMRAELAALRTETRERLDRIETRMSAMETTLGSLYALAGTDRESVHSLTRRIERIERRLELSDQPVP
jgi:hypothetical protein